jgi:DNA-binding CsgD family transcriptional regulator
VAGRRRYISPSVASDLLLSPSEPVGGLLTNRERQVLLRVVAGETDREIARALGIAVRTVRSHLDNIRKKTGERRRPDLTRFAITHGMWSPRSEGIEGVHDSRSGVAWRRRTRVDRCAMPDRHAGSSAHRRRRNGGLCESVGA